MQASSTPFKMRIMLLSTNLAKDRLQIHTDLLLTSFPGVLTSITLNDLEPQKYRF